MTERNDDFYVGWMERAHGAAVDRARKAIVSIFCIAAIVAVVLVTRQAPFGNGVFEFGVMRELSGILREHPYPTLELKRPGVPVDGVPSSRYLLVAFGKHGAARQTEGLDGRRVRLRGSLVYRDGQTMIELVDGSIETLDGESSPPYGVVEELGEVTLVGEIVDSKCWLGVMKPATLKPHRACATRCISGGIPPLLLVEDAAGRTLHFLLVGADGDAVHREVLDRVAEPVEIRGRLTRQGDRFVLYADPADYRGVRP